MSEQDQSSGPWFEQPSGIGSYGDVAAEEPTVALDPSARRPASPPQQPPYSGADNSLPEVNLYDPHPGASGATAYGSDQQWNPHPGAQSYGDGGGTSGPYGDSGRWNQNQYAYGQGGGASGPYGNAMYPAQTPYGWAPGYAGAEHPQATTVLVMGVLSFVLPVVPFIAWYMGGKAKAEIERGAPYTYSGSLKIGHIMGKVLGILSLVGVGFYALIMVLALGMFAI